MDLIAILLVGGGIAIAAFGINQVRKTRNAALNELLEIRISDNDSSPQELSALLEKAGAFAGKALERTPVADRLSTLMIQSGTKVTAGEFGGMVFVASVLTGMLLLLLTNSLPLVLVAMIAVPLVALSRIKRKARKRVELLETQLPEVLQLVAGSLDSGTSLLTAFELAAKEGDAPLSLELARVVGESSVGRPMLEALESMADRVGSNDYAWTAKAIRIQYQTGGRLADTLRILADFMQARVEVRGEIKALSAEAKFSGKVLTGMPIVIGMILVAIRGDYIAPLFTETGGRMMLGVAVTGVFLGHVWMKKMGRVEL